MSDNIRNTGIRAMSKPSDALLEVIRREKVPYKDPERLFLVLGLLLSGRISMGKAAELLGLRVDELWMILKKLGVNYEIIDMEEADEEVGAYREIFENSV